MGEDSPIETAIQTIKDWTGDTKEMLRARAPSLTGAGAKSIKGKVKLRNLEPYAVGFNFERYIDWVDKGASRGHGGTKGSTWYNKKGDKKRTNPESLRKMNSGNRLAEPFIDAVITERLPILAGLLAKELADSVVRFATMR
jgi:hypothetical protein